MERERIEREILSFNKLNPLEQEWFLTETWCTHCNEADLGIVDPVYFRQGEKEFIEGRCNVCDTIQTTEIVVRQLQN